ncbi:karyopherin [Saitoella coloradoensis]
MDPSALPQIVNALAQIHNPLTPNDVRKQLQTDLENLKENYEFAPIYGFELAKATEAEGVDVGMVRHFGLSMLEGCIRYAWTNYSDEQKLELKGCVVQLVIQEAQRNSPSYVPEKLSVLLTEIAKRAWFSPLFPEYSVTLLGLWRESPKTRLIALSSLTSLMEDTFILDDPVCALRHQTLTAGMLSVLMSDTVRKNLDTAPVPGAEFDEREARDIGWFARWAECMTECSVAADQGGEGAQIAIKLGAAVLKAFKICIGLTPTECFIEAQLLQRLCSALMCTSVQIATLAADCLYLLFSRQAAPTDPFMPQIATMFQIESLAGLEMVYDRVCAGLDPEALDEDYYIYLKKLVEAIVALGVYNLLDEVRAAELPSDESLEKYFGLVMKTSRHESLLVSSLSQGFWEFSLRNKRLNEKEALARIVPHLLELAGERLIKYEEFKGETEIAAFKNSLTYLETDIDSIPEMHMFTGNYRRFLFDIARLCVCKRPAEAVAYTNQRLNMFLNMPPDPAHRDSMGFCTKKNHTYLLCDSTFVLIEATIRGVKRWETLHPGDEYAAVKQQCSSTMQEWCERIVGLDIKDPLMLGKQVQVIVSFAGAVLEGNQALMFKVLEKVLTGWAYVIPDADKTVLGTLQEVRGKCGQEMLKLGAMLPNQLWPIYDQLEKTVNEMSSDIARLSRTDLPIPRALLLIIAQRSTISQEVKKAKFEDIVSPVCNAWTEADITNKLSSLEGFMEMMGLDKMMLYFRKRGIAPGANLSNIELDAEGEALQKEQKELRRWVWPLRGFRKFIECTVDSHSKEHPQHQFTLDLWAPKIGQIVPNILMLLRQVHAYYTPANYASLPAELQYIVQQSVIERYWLHGVSTTTKDEFIAGSKATGTIKELVESAGDWIRQTREYCYILLGVLSNLDTRFYSMPGLSQTIMQSLFTNVDGLSLHAWTHLLNIGVRPLVVNCPESYRGDFLQAVLPPLLHELDAKLVREWARLTQRGLLTAKADEGQDGSADGEGLSSEMMEESLMRHLSFAAIRLSADIIQPVSERTVQAHLTQTGRSANAKTEFLHLQSLKQYVLGSPAIVEPLLVLCTHFLTTHDTRCCSKSIALLREIIPELVQPRGQTGEINAVQNYICTEIFRAGVLALHDEYFIEQQKEITTLLTLIYIQGISVVGSSAPREIIKAAIPTFDHQDFERKLGQAKTSKHQRGIMWALLESIKGVAKGEQGKKTVSAQQENKELIQRLLKAGKERQNETENHLDGLSTMMDEGNHDGPPPPAQLQISM